MTVVEMIARNAQMYPNDVALIELRPSKKMRRQITWGEFDELKLKKGLKAPSTSVSPGRARRLVDFLLRQILYLL